MNFFPPSGTSGAMQIKDIHIDQNRMETTQHGTYSFPMAIYYDVISNNVLGFVNWHWHKELQLCYVVEGKVSFCVSGRQYDLTSGNGIFICPGALHMIHSADHTSGIYICLNFDSRLLTMFSGSVMENRYVLPYLDNPALEIVPLYSRIPWQKEILDRILSTFRLYTDQDFGYEFHIAATLAEMWLLLIQNTTFSDTKNHSRSDGNLPVHAILDYLAAHYSEKITIKDIAAAVPFSDSECCRMFKRALNVTIFTYLKTLRIEKSTLLLQNTSMSISQIAYSVGFCSTSYFIKSFKEVVGETPYRFRSKRKL